MNKLRFRGQWRSYQERILNNLNEHLLDDKLHIVAAPGAGKTTLGIEAISRLNKPALILVPTNTIKNQWKERICSSFLDEKDWNIVSTDIKQPSYLTVITYQALLAAFCGSKVNENADEEEEETITSSKRFNFAKAEEVINILRNAKISLLCFDEAHHLRKEWWKALSYLIDELCPEQTFALTATPPYDVDISEWQRYEDLCGPIDEVISIPELVQNGDLCPHQDFIYFSTLRHDENEFISKYNANVRAFMKDLSEDRSLFMYLRGMSFLTPDDNELSQILEEPDLYISIVSLLHSVGFDIPKKFLQLFDAKPNEIPDFDLKQAKIFLNGFLIKNTSLFLGMEKRIEYYLNLAKRLGLIQNKKIVLDDSAKVQKQIANSLGKIDSIIQIVEAENANLGKNLRMVVLTDYIKADNTDNSKLGVVPIWRSINKHFGRDLSIGILCGSLIVIPATQKEELSRLLSEYSVSEDCISITPYVESSNYIKITPKESVKNCIVSIITELFNRGFITILVGTQALLGEGWDAPSINSLILSSTVSSYMLSNQMRGRAIRKDKNNPNKVSNIWHLASITVQKEQGAEFFTKSSSNIDLNCLYDIQQLTKRFDGYEAPSYFENHEIMNGISRILPDKFINNSEITENSFLKLNEDTLARAKNREETANLWAKAFYRGYNAPEMALITGISASKVTPDIFVYDGYKKLIYGVFTLFTLFALIAIFKLSLGFFIIVCLGFLCYLIPIGLQYLRTGTVEGVLKQVAQVYLETLHQIGLIKTEPKSVLFFVDDIVGSMFLFTFNLPIEEDNLLIRSLQEFFNPIDNPRYLLLKKDKFLHIVKQIDYFAIPSVIAAKKEYVKIFESLWRKYIGDCEIIYTRNYEGRKLLLKARKNAFSSTKRDETKKLSKWR